MINEHKWINSLSKKKIDSEDKSFHIEGDKWTSTIPKKNIFNSFKKYSLLGICFVIGLFLVSAVKNETRKLQKEITSLEKSIDSIKFSINQAKLDNEVITSPENISQLAKENLNIDFVVYKKNQIKNLDEKDLSITKIIEVNEKSKISKKVKLKIAKKVERKKEELKKLQELYSNPELLPDEIKTQVAKKIEKKKIELKKIYYSPGDAFKLENVQRWGVIQVVKLFLGIPVVPGR